MRGRTPSSALFPLDPGDAFFAAGANREQIVRCTELGLEGAEFIALGLEAMKGIAEEIGL